MAALESQLVVLQGAVQLRHGQAVEAVAVVPAAIPLRARNRLHEAAIGAVHHVGAVAVVDAAIVLDLGHALGDQVELVEIELIGAVVVADRTVEAVERVSSGCWSSQRRRSRGCRGADNPAKDRGRACTGLPRPASLLPSSLLPSGFSAAGFSSALAAGVVAGGAGGWLLGEAGAAAAGGAGAGSATA